MLKFQGNFSLLLNILIIFFFGSFLRIKSMFELKITNFRDVCEILIIYVIYSHYIW